MRFLGLFFFNFIFLFTPCFAQLQFHAKDEILHYRIDFTSKDFWKELVNGEWRNLGKLNFENVNKNEIPVNAVLNVHSFKKSYLISISGTQQVYLLSPEIMKLKRLDKTFYRGYNFQSIQYLRGDTLFSHGGMGFWHANNVSTYFSFKSNEWEMSTPPDDIDPLWMTRNFGGYDEQRNLLSIIEFPSIYDAKSHEKKYTYFEKTFINNEWKRLGYIDIDLIRQLGINRLESEFIHGLYFFLNGPILVWADPNLNEIYQIDGPNKVFNLNYEISYKDGYFYSYHRMESVTNAEGLIKIDSISLNKLKSISTRKGAFYIKPYPIELMAYLAIAFLILISGSIIIYQRRKVHENPNEQHLDGLPVGASEFLHACLKHPQGHAFSSQHFTEMMGYGSYAYETQRQVRAKLIKGINSYFWAHYRLDDVIIRQTANDDKRYSVYLIAESHYDTLKKLLNV